MGFLDREQLVCVTRRELGLFELADRAAVQFTGLHGILPRMSVVQQLIVSHLMRNDRPRAGGRPVCEPGIRRSCPS